MRSRTSRLPTRIASRLSPESTMRPPPTNVRRVDLIDSVCKLAGELLVVLEPPAVPRRRRTESGHDNLTHHRPSHSPGTPLVKNLKLAHKMLVLTDYSDGLRTDRGVCRRSTGWRSSTPRFESSWTARSRKAIWRPTCSTGLCSASAPRRIRSSRRTTSPPRSTRRNRGRSMSEARARLDKLKELVAADHAEGQAAAVEALGKAIDAFEKVNNDDRRPGSAKHQRQGEKAAGRRHATADQYPRRAFPEMARSGDQRQRRCVSGCSSQDSLRDQYRVLELFPNTIKHIDSTRDEEMSDQEKKLAELQEQIQNGLAIASGGEPTEPGRAPRRAGRHEICLCKISSSCRA